MDNTFDLFQPDLAINHSWYLSRPAVVYFLFNPVNFICLKKATFFPILACVGYFVANPHTLDLLYTGPVLCCIFIPPQHWSVTNTTACPFTPKLATVWMFFCDLQYVILFGCVPVSFQYPSSSIFIFLSDMTQLQMFQKVEYGWGSICKVVLEC